MPRSKQIVIKVPRGLRLKKNVNSKVGTGFVNYNAGHNLLK